MSLVTTPDAAGHAAPVHPQSYPRGVGHGRVRGLLPIVAAGLIGVVEPAGTLKPRIVTETEHLLPDWSPQMLT